jgi:hypothetical protein
LREIPTIDQTGSLAGGQSSTGTGGTFGNGGG